MHRMFAIPQKGRLLAKGLLFSLIYGIVVILIRKLLLHNGMVYVLKEPGYYILAVIFFLLFFSFLYIFVRLISYWQGEGPSARSMWWLLFGGVSFRFVLLFGGILFAWFSQPPFVVVFMFLYLAFFFYFLAMELIAWSHFLNWFDK